VRYAAGAGSAGAAIYRSPRTSMSFAKIAHPVHRMYGYIMMQDDLSESEEVLNETRSGSTVRRERLQ